jgi:hypothetical protein
MYMHVLIIHDLKVLHVILSASMLFNHTFSLGC